MTKDFVLDFTDALRKEGVPFFIAIQNRENDTDVYVDTEHWKPYEGQTVTQELLKIVLTLAHGPEPEE